MLPIRTGSAAKHTQDYARHGNSTLFAELDIANGNVSAATHGTSGGEFLARLNTWPARSELCRRVGQGTECSTSAAQARV